MLHVLQNKVTGFYLTDAPSSRTFDPQHHTFDLDKAAMFTSFRLADTERKRLREFAYLYIAIPAESARGAS